jgi:hypothetical protein
MKDWLKAFTAALAAVSLLVALFIPPFFGCAALLDHLGRTPEVWVRAYASPDGKYVATVKTEAGGPAFASCNSSSVLVHPASVSSDQAIEVGKQYLILQGNCDAKIKWESANELQLDVSWGSTCLERYGLAPIDASQQILIHFKL